jgi:hypothetical protein
MVIPLRNLRDFRIEAAQVIVQEIVLIISRILVESLGYFAFLLTDEISPGGTGTSRGRRGGQQLRSFPEQCKRLFVYE